jgi:endonuclease/exonuclease/phosphatase (EEP) superfamily protein YafD
MQVITDVLNFLLRSTYLVVLAACALPVIGVWFGDLHWSLELASQFLLPVIIVSCIVAIFAGLTRHSLIGVGALLIAIVASSVAGPWMSVPKSAPANAPVFSVLFLNVWIRNDHLDQVAKLIHDRNADIVVLVEASPRLRDAIKDVAQAYPYHADCADNAGCGTIILSRARLTPLDISSYDVSTLSVQADLAGCQMPVTAVHLKRPFPFSPVGDQLRQAVDVSNIVLAWSGPQLVMGDFNAAPWSPVMKTILQRSRLALLTGSGGTWPSVLPKQMRIPIDHMMAGRGLSFVSRELPAFVGSDHAPVFARVAVTDPSLCANR